MAAEAEIATSCVALLATKGGVLVIAREPQSKVVERANDVALDRRHSDAIAGCDLGVRQAVAPIEQEHFSRICEQLVQH
jgi:hypothetical protein